MLELLYYTVLYKEKIVLTTVYMIQSILYTSIYCTDQYCTV